MGFYDQTHFPTPIPGSESLDQRRDGEGADEVADRRAGEQQISQGGVVQPVHGCNVTFSIRRCTCTTIYSAEFVPQNSVPRQHFDSHALFCNVIGLQTRGWSVKCLPAITDSELDTTRFLFTLFISHTLPTSFEFIALGSADPLRGLTDGNRQFLERNQPEARWSFHSGTAMFGVGELLFPISHSQDNTSGICRKLYCYVKIECLKGHHLKLSVFFSSVIVQ